MIRTLLAAALLSSPGLAAAQASNPGDNEASSQSPAAMFQRPGDGAGAAADEGVRFTGNHAFRTLNCRGGDAVVSGDGNQLKLTDCSRLTLSGAKNQISVTLSSPGDIVVSGSRNAVRYRAPDDGAPRVSDTGAGDDIRPMAG